MGEWEPFSREKYLICHQKWCVMCRKFHNRFPHCFAINFATHLTPKLHSNDINTENIELGKYDDQNLCANAKRN